MNAHIIKKFFLLSIIIYYLFFLSSIASAQQYTYDELGRLVRTVYTDGSVVEYQYDAAGNRTREIVSARLSMIETPWQLDVNELGSAAFDVVLTSAPESDVEVAISSSNTAKATVSPSHITFTSQNWNTKQTVTVSGLHDADQNHDNVNVVLVASGGLEENDTVVAKVWDDEAPLTMEESIGNFYLNEGQIFSFAVNLSRQPASTVLVNLSSSNTDSVAISPASIVFTTGNWFTPQLVHVSALKDANTTNENVQITLQATGGLSETDVVPVSVNDNDGTNQSPYVSINYPLNNSTYSIFTDITIEASASDPNGSVSKVEFYDGTTLLATDTTSPYTASWNTGLPGLHALKTVVTDNMDATSQSSLISVNVVGNPAPQVTITSPINEEKFIKPVDVTITVDAFDPGGSISKVDFYHGWNDTTWFYLGTANAAPFTYKWKDANQQAITCLIKAVATDNEGATGTSNLVSVKIRNSSCMEVSSSENFNSGGNPGGPFNPPNMNYRINAYYDDVPWTATSDVNWLTVSPSGGQATMNQFSDAKVEINENANSLPKGIHIGTVTFTNTETGQGNTTRQVRLDVGGAQWQKTNGPQGGLVNAFAFHSSGMIFCGTWDGVYRSSDNGNTWAAANSGLKSRITCLSMNNSMLFAGTYSQGVYRSSDNGNTWTQVNSGLTYPRINTLVVNASGILFASAFGGGIFRSEDNGNSWTQINNGLPEPYVSDIAINPNNQNLFAAHGSRGVYRSSDNGNTWTAINSGLPELCNSQCIAIHPASNVIFLATSGWMYKSSDNGNSWAELGVYGYYTLAIKAGAGLIFSGHSVPYRSNDNGSTWTLINTNLPSTSTSSSKAIGIHPTTGDIFLGKVNGVYRSSNNGDSWTEITEGLYSVSVNGLTAGDSRGNVFAATSNHLQKSANNGDSWTKLSNGLSSVDIQYSKVFYHPVSKSIFAIQSSTLWRSNNNGDSWSQVYSGNLFSDMVIHPDTGAIFLSSTSSGGVLRSTDNGSSWIEVNNGIADKTIYAMAITPNGATLLAAAYGKIYRSSDNGSNWAEITNSLDQINCLSVQPGTGYVFAGSYSGIYRSTDLGNTWTNVKENLRCVALAIDPNYGIFAGIDDAGIQRSQDNGTNWNPMNEGLTNVNVRSLSIAGSSGIIYAGTAAGVFRRQFPLPEIALTSPKGGESWGKNSQQRITWNTNDAGINKVDIFYSADNGRSWQTLSTNETNDGSYSWEITQAVNNTSLIKIVGYDAASSAYEDQSEATFSIFQPNRPPYAPTSPSPVDNATNIGIDTQISWQGGDPDIGDTVLYDIYLGTANPPQLRQSGYNGTTFTPGFLISNTKYYWKIVARDSIGATQEGEKVWSFTTTEPLIAFNVSSPYGNPQGAGNYSLGTLVSSSVTSPTSAINNTRYQCTGFTGTGSVPSQGSASFVSFSISQNSTVTFNWAAQYQLTINIDPPGAGSVSNASWYKSGTPCTLTASANAGYQFSYWSGDIDGFENPMSLTMDSPKQITAHFTSELESIAIEGPDFVAENSSQNYVCRAYYKDGSNKITGCSWNENSGYATIFNNGTLQTTQTTGNQSCLITASYSEFGIDKTANKNVIVQDHDIVFTLHPQSQTVNPDTQVSFSVSATGSEPMSYQWKKGGTSIPNATSSTFTISNVKENDEGSYICTVSNAFTSADSNAATLAVNDPPVITSHPASQTKNPGDSLSFTVVATGSRNKTDDSRPLSYQWKKGGTSIPNATSATFTIASVQESDEGSFTCMVSNMVTSVTSNAATLTINDPSVITEHPVSQTKNPGDAVSFTVVATGTNPLSYQWKKGESNIPNATSATFTIENVQESDEGSYSCIVSNMVTSVTSNAAVLTVNDHPVIVTVNSTQPSDNLLTCYTVGYDNFAWPIQWKTNSGPDRIEICQSFLIKGASDWTIDKIAIKVRDFGTSVEKQRFILQVWSVSDASDITGDTLISTQSGTFPSSNLTAGYWTFDLDNIKLTAGQYFAFVLGFETGPDSERFISAINAYSAEDLYLDGRMFVRRGNPPVWSYAGASSNRDFEFYIQGFSHTVSKPNTPIGAGTAITEQNITYTSGGSTCSEGHNVEYQFDWGDEEISNWSTATSANHIYTKAGNYSIKARARCQVNPIILSPFSDSVSLIVYDPPVITSHPVSQAKNPGESVSFSVTATGSNPLSYQWKKGGSNISNATSATFTIASPQESDEGSYTCTVSNMVASVTSNAATLTINDPPVITSHPVSQTKNPGDSVSFTVVATGSRDKTASSRTLSYQWKKGASNIPNATSSTFTIASAQESDEGSYTCTVSNMVASVTSNAATLTINDSPVITSHPVSQTKNPGDSVSFTVVATGSRDKTASSRPLSYQWKKGASNIPNATSSTFTIASAQESDEGSYTCTVSNMVSSVTSNAATLTVNDPPLTIAIHDVSTKEGLGYAAFSVTLNRASTLPVTVVYQTANGTATAGSDYQTMMGTLSFPSGVTAQMLLVGLFNDTIVEGNETFYVNLTKPTNAIIGDAQGECIIVEDDTNLSINDVSVVEGNPGRADQVKNKAIFTVIRSGVTNQADIVYYQTVNGTAIGNVDYQIQTGIVAFEIGSTQKTIEIVINEDNIYELDETFYVNLFNPTHATIIKAQGKGTITNDEPLPGISIISNIAIAEKSRIVNFTVSLSSPSVQAITVKYQTSNDTAMAGSDYAAQANTLVFQPGVIAQVISVGIVDDIVVEPDENFSVNLSNPVNATIKNGQGVCTILNDDTNLSINDVSVVEGNPGRADQVKNKAIFTVTRSGVTNQADIVYYQTANGTAIGNVDYQMQTGIVAFEIGSTQKTIEIVINEDNIYELDETFYVNLFNPTHATIVDPQGKGTITNDDPLPGISIISNIAVAEKSKIVNFTVSLSSPSVQAITVKYQTNNGTAMAGSDYAAQANTLVFQPGVIAQVILVGIVDDIVVEPDENFSVNLSNPVNATINNGQGVCTILNDDTNLSINDVSVAEGNPGRADQVKNKAIFTVTRSGVTNQADIVYYQTVNGTAIGNLDYQIQTGIVAFEIGSTQKTIEIVINEDNIYELDETFYVNLFNPTNATIVDPQGKGTITNDDPLPGISIISNIAVAEKSKIVNFTVSLSSPSVQAITVKYQTSNDNAMAGSDYAAQASTLVFQPGVIAQVISVGIVDDIVVEPDENFSVNLSNPVNATINNGQGVCTILNDDISIAINDISVIEGDSDGTNAVFSVTRAGDMEETTIVQYQTVNGTAISGIDYQVKAGILTFPPGVATQNIEVSVTGDPMRETDETFFVNLLNAKNGNILDNQGKCTIINDDSQPSISIQDANVTEPASGIVYATFIVDLSAPSVEPITVKYQTTNNTATSPSDYQTNAGLLVFNPGVTTQKILIAVIGDAVFEPNETFFVKISGATNATISDDQGIGTIVSPAPLLKFTYVPPLNSHNNLAGQVLYVKPADYKVAVYIKVGTGWWTKPFWNAPKTSINANGSWACDITTSGNDPQATQITAFLIPNSYDPPILSENTTLPAELYSNAVASMEVVRSQKETYRIITFSQYEWRVKDSTSLAGPGPNYFSSSAESLWLDQNGHLHMKIRKDGDKWLCSEVVLQKNLGYGTYSFHVSQIDILDNNAVLGLFTWDDTSEQNRREIDIEISKWGNEVNENLQYVVQPREILGNMERLTCDLTKKAIHSFDWSVGNILFQTLDQEESFLLHSLNYKGSSIPSPGKENVRMNLWLYNTVPPSSELEVVIEKFQFTAK